MEEESSSDSDEDDEHRRDHIPGEKQHLASAHKQLSHQQTADGKKLLSSVQPSMQPPLPPAPDKVIVKKG